MIVTDYGDQRQSHRQTVSSSIIIIAPKDNELRLAAAEELALSISHMLPSTPTKNDSEKPPMEADIVDIRLGQRHRDTVFVSVV